MVHQENVGTRGSKTGPLLVHHQGIVEARRRDGVGGALAKGEVGPLVHQEIPIGLDSSSGFRFVRF